MVPAVVVAVVALAAHVAVLPAALLLLVALVVLFLQFPAQQLREAQLLRPVPLPPEVEVAGLLVLVQGLVASESLGSR